MTLLRNQSGFALITVTAMMALVMALALALMQIQLSNAQAAAAQYRGIQARLLLNSGLHYAALSLASPRTEVAANAVPFERLIYPNALAEVLVALDNEAGRVDLMTAHPDLLDAALEAAGAQPTDIERVKQALQAALLPGPTGASPRSGSVRQAWSVLQQMPIDAEQLWDISTIVNGQAGVHPQLASAAVLAIVPGLSAAEQTHLLAQRSRLASDATSSSLVGEAFKESANPHLRANVSSYYRVRAEVRLANQLYSRTWIIRMHNEPQRLFSIVAHWQD